MENKLISYSNFFGMMAEVFFNLREYNRAMFYSGVQIYFQNLYLRETRI